MTRHGVRPNITRRGGSQRGARCGVSVSRSPRAARRPARWRGGAGWQSPPAAARGEARPSMLGGCTGGCAGGCTGGRARANAGWGGAGGKRGSRAAVRRARLQQVLCSRCAEASRRLRAATTAATASAWTSSVHATLAGLGRFKVGRALTLLLVLECMITTSTIGYFVGFGASLGLWGWSGEFTRRAT